MAAALPPAPLIYSPLTHRLTGASCLWEEVRMRRGRNLRRLAMHPCTTTILVLCARRDGRDARSKASVHDTIRRMRVLCALPGGLAHLRMLNNRTQVADVLARGDRHEEEASILGHPAS